MQIAKCNLGIATASNGAESVNKAGKEVVKFLASEEFQKAAHAVTVFFLATCGIQAR